QFARVTSPFVPSSPESSLPAATSATMSSRAAPAILTCDSSVRPGTVDRKRSIIVMRIFITKSSLSNSPRASHLPTPGRRKKNPRSAVAFSTQMIVSAKSHFKNFGYCKATPSGFLLGPQDFQPHRLQKNLRIRLATHRDAQKIGVTNFYY